MALNSLLCADVPLSNYLLTRLCTRMCTTFGFHCHTAYHMSISVLLCGGSRLENLGHSPFL